MRRTSRGGWLSRLAAKRQKSWVGHPEFEPQIRKPDKSAPVTPCECRADHGAPICGLLRRLRPSSNFTCGGVIWRQVEKMVATPQKRAIPTPDKAKSPTRRLLRKNAPGSTRSCDPESTSICGGVGEVDPQSRSVAATRRGWPAAAGQGARLIGVDLRSTQQGRPRVDFYRSQPAVDSERSPQGRL